MIVTLDQQVSDVTVLQGLLQRRGRLDTGRRDQVLSILALQQDLENRVPAGAKCLLDRLLSQQFRVVGTEPFVPPALDGLGDKAAESRRDDDGDEQHDDGSTPDGGRQEGDDAVHEFGLVYGRGRAYTVRRSCTLYVVMCERAQDEVAEPLSRQSIVAAAIHLTQQVSVTELSMRQVARHMKRAPMSLYRHIADVEQLRQLVVGTLIDTVDLTDHGCDWRRTTTEAAHRLRELFSADPGIVIVIMRSGLSTPGMVKNLDVMMGALRTAGLGWDDVARGHSALMCLIFGSAVLQRSLVEAFQREFIQNLIPDDHGGLVNMKAVAPAWAEMAPDEPFDFALDRLMDGIERLGRP